MFKRRGPAKGLTRNGCRGAVAEAGHSMVVMYYEEHLKQQRPTSNRGGTMRILIGLGSPDYSLGPHPRRISTLAATP